MDRAHHHKEKVKTAVVGDTAERGGMHWGENKGGEHDEVFCGPSYKKMHRHHQIMATCSASNGAEEMGTHHHKENNT